MKETETPEYWVYNHIIGKTYNVDKYTVNRFIEAMEYLIEEKKKYRNFWEASEVTCRILADKVDLLEEQLKAQKREGGLE